MSIAVLVLDWDLPVRYGIDMATIVKSLGDGYEQRANVNQTYSRADGIGGVTSYKGRNRFGLSLDLINYANGDATQQVNKLWTFYKARLGAYEAFYFYSPKEAPAGGDGSSATGRYLVRFEDNNLSLEQFAILLHRGQLNLIEVRS